MFKRGLCLFAAFTVLFCCSVPAFATGMTPGGVGGGVAGIPVVGEIQLDVVDFSRYCDDKLRGYGNFIWNLLDNDVCSHAPQFGGGHSFVPRRTQVDGQIGTYYVCEYCGRASGEVLEEAYDEYVETLPGNTVNSDGSFLWVLTPDACPSTGPIYTDDTYPFGSVRLDGSQRYEGSGSGYDVTGYAVPGQSIVVSALDWRYHSQQFCRIYSFAFTCPFDATYQLLSGGFLSPPARFGSAGSSYDLGKTVKDRPLNLAWPVFKVTPLEMPSGLVSDTRVSGGNVSASGTGSFGYVQDGQLYQSTTRDIFSETSNIYNNPVTGDTSNIENWTYDYSDRSYTLTTDEGDTVTVTYGDTNVTINDGGTTYNVYYLTEHEDIPEHHYTSSVTLAPTCTGTGVRTYTCIDADCNDTYTEIISATGHSYQSAVTMSPSCINTGVRTFTCSACGDVYTVSIPSTGHTWQVLQTVPTVYDEGGQLVTEGYTLYQCATCGEQYKITAASGGASLPSPGGGGTSTDTHTDSFLVELDPHVGRGFLATIAHGLTEDLPEVLKAASAWFTEFPAFYSGFTAFLRDGIAGCLPDIVRKTMGFGLSMITFVGVVRKIIGR